MAYSTRPQSVLVLTGAGISAESGLGTFRDSDGVWAKFDPAELATPEAFEKNPHKVYEFYNMRRADLLAAKPNDAHYALAELERRVAHNGGKVVVVTQNIDNLHERAGSTNVLHMHGELLKSRCHGPRGGCHHVFEWEHDLSTNLACPACGQAGHLRPHVVWFNEVPFLLNDIARLLDEADLFVSIGTSGTVWPAAGFVMKARARGVETLELNLEPTASLAVFDSGIYGPASVVTPEWVASMTDRLSLHHST